MKIKIEITTKTIYKLFVFALINIQLMSCDKIEDSTSEDINSTDYILAGELDENTIIVRFNKVLSTEIREGVSETLGNYPFDLNNDSIADLEFRSQYTWAMAGGIQSNWSELAAKNACEILMDTSSKEYISIIGYDTIQLYENIVMPKILNEGDTISKRGIWLSETKAYLCYHLESPVSFGPLIRQTDIFFGWINNTKKYMGYRIHLENDTLYGWLGLEMRGYNMIYLGESCNR